MVASGAATKGVTVMKQTPPAAVGRRHLLEISASAAGVIALSACSGSPPEPGKGRPDTTPEQEVPVTAPEDLMREHGVLKRILLIYREGIRRLQADDQSPAPALNESAQRTAALNLFVVVEAFYLFSCRSLTRSAWRLGMFANRWIILGVSAQAIAQFAITYLPAMNMVFDTAPIDIGVWVRIFAVATAITIVVATDTLLPRIRAQPP